MLSGERSRSLSRSNKKIFFCSSFLHSFPTKNVLCVSGIGERAKNFHFFTHIHSHTHRRVNYWVRWIYMPYRKNKIIKKVMLLSVSRSFSFESVGNWKKELKSNFFLCINKIKSVCVWLIVTSLIMQSVKI